MYIHARDRRTGPEGPRSTPFSGLEDHPYGLGQSTRRFEGVFTGTLHGDTHTKSDVKVTLTHRDTEIAGTIALASGLRILFGAPCGLERIDVGTVPVKAMWDSAKPDHLEAVGDVDEKTEHLPGFTMKMRITLVADFVDRDTASATLTIDPLGPATDTCGTRTMPLLLKRWY